MTSGTLLLDSGTMLDHRGEARFSGSVWMAGAGTDRNRSIDFRDAGEPTAGFDLSDDLTIVGDLAATGTNSFVRNEPMEPTRSVFVALEGDEAETCMRGIGRRRLLPGHRATVSTKRERWDRGARARSAPTRPLVPDATTGIATYNAPPMAEATTAATRGAASGSPGYRPARGWRIGAVAVLVAAVSVAHYATPPEHFLLHNVFQRLYYIPVLLACSWFGLAGGLAAAAVSAVAYTPHILLHWKHSQAYQASQVLELAMFGVVAIVAGLLSDRERALRLRAEETAAQRDRALRDLEATVDGLRRADRLAALGTLTAGMAHEIRNPLGAVAGAAEILAQDYPSGHPRREFLEILRREIARLGTIAGKYLDYARPEAPEPRSIDVNSVVRAAVDLVSKEASRTSVTFRVTADAERRGVLADPDQIQQVLLNLLLNAAQAMPNGGEVEVGTERHGEMVAVTVRDRGPGLPDVAPERLFEPFFSTRPSGTGLGLHVSRRIVQSHGGRIEAESVEGGGARFVVLLPWSPEVER